MDTYTRRAAVRHYMDAKRFAREDGRTITRAEAWATASNTAERAALFAFGEPAATRTHRQAVAALCLDAARFANGYAYPTA